jgi:hypothetical protein
MRWAYRHMWGGTNAGASRLGRTRGPLCLLLAACVGLSGCGVVGDIFESAEDSSLTAGVFWAGAVIGAAGPVLVAAPVTVPLGMQEQGWGAMLWPLLPGLPTGVLVGGALAAPFALLSYLGDLVSGDHSDPWRDEYEDYDVPPYDGYDDSGYDDYEEPRPGGLRQESAESRRAAPPVSLSEDWPLPEAGPPGPRGAKQR